MLWAPASSCMGDLHPSTKMEVVESMPFQNAQTLAALVRMTLSTTPSMLADVFDAGDQEEEEDAVVQQVLAELGVAQTAGMVDAPAGRVGAGPVAEPAAAAPAEEEDDQLAALQARMEKI